MHTTLRRAGVAAVIAAVGLSPLVSLPAATACGGSSACAPVAQTPRPSTVTADTVNRPAADSTAGWTRTFVDDFDRTTPGPGWPAYTGPTGGNPDNRWTASQVTVANGALRLTGAYVDGRWITGGTTNMEAPQRYGRWDIRMRADRSDEISYHVLLWPADDSWPPEIDIAESNDPARRSMSGFLHWNDARGTHQKQEFPATGVFDRLHTLTLEWLPTRITWKLDGVTYAEVTDPAKIPSIPMRLAIQTESGSCEWRATYGQTPCPTPVPTTPASVEVDNVTVYAPA